VVIVSVLPVANRGISWKMATNTDVEIVITPCRNVRQHWRNFG